MNALLAVLRGIGCILLGFVVVFLVNLPHDWFINSVQPGSVRAGIPVTTQAAVLSSGIIFLAGVAASFVVCSVSGPHRKTVLLVLTGLFLLSDVLAVTGPLAGASLWYRIMAVALVPLEVWVGYLLANRLLGRYSRPVALVVE